jgi:hypothetical protein
MTALNLINQLLNLIAPAGFVALLLVLLVNLFPRLFRVKKVSPPSLGRQLLIVFGLSVLLLVAGLVVFGRDGKMATYALLVLGAATAQWILLRGWKS